jgi:hypothetical protein
MGYPEILNKHVLLWSHLNVKIEVYYYLLQLGAHPMAVTLHWSLYNTNQSTHSTRKQGTHNANPNMCINNSRWLSFAFSVDIILDN